jgi:uncharacterized protein
MQTRRRLSRIVSCTLALVVLSLPLIVPVSTFAIDLDPPGDREFVLDQAGLLDADATRQIQALCDQLLKDKATPIVVVTIESMAKYDGGGLGIETFATLLFNQWEIGHASLNGQNWNTGILLLVSVRDRKARIELGAGWGRSKDSLCQRIMDGQIIPPFKQGRYSDGIVDGVAALDRMARELSVPRRPMTNGKKALILLVVGLAVFTFTSLIRRGSSGWAWLFWSLLFGVLVAILVSDSDGGGFGGGSFGGGFSGGGGASGSW